MNKQDVEEGVALPKPVVSPLPDLAMADDKSDAGSATTAPSVESASVANPNANPSSNEDVKPKSRRCMTLVGGATVLIVGGIILATVLATRNTSPSTTSSTSFKNEESISLGGEGDAPPFYQDGVWPKPFPDTQLPLFHQDVLQVYPNRQALEADLTKAAQEVVNKVVLQNMMYDSNGNPNSPPDLMEMEDIALLAAQGVSTASASSASSASKQAATNKIKEWSKTNNQEEDVDEADVLKTDSTYVYAAYGDYLVVWDLQGNIVTQEKMPVPEEPEEDTTSTTSSRQEDDMFFDDPFFMPMAYAYIDSIQLTQDHVLVVVGGLGHYHDDSIGFGDEGTHLRVYNKPTATQPTLQLVATRQIQGYFFGSRFLEATNSVHIVTGGDFNTYSALVEPLDLYNFNHQDQTQYYQAAVKKATEELIPKFVTQLADFFIDANDGAMPNIMQVNNWMTQEQFATRDDKIHPEDHFYGSYDEALRAYLQVTSISVNDLPTTPLIDDGETSLTVSTTALIGPSSWGFMYATQDSIVLHMGKYDWNPETEHSEETLYLFHLKVADDAQLTFHSTTALSGYLPGQKAVDIQGNDLRVAITHQKWMPLENVWPVCGDSWYFEDSCMNEDNWNTCFETALTCRNVVKTGCPYTIECADEESEGVESSTDNTVFVFDISQAGQMTERGSVRIGEPHEVIMGVHFGETFSYANTFDQRDPFYVLKLEEGQPPAIEGELKLDGFSTYLQPLNEDGSLLVGIGQNVSGVGMDQMPSGLLVTVFDVSDKANPKAIASDMLADPKEFDSYSDAEWDPKAVQYQDGLLVIPLTLYQKYHDDDGNWMNVEEEEEVLEDVMVMEENTPSPFHFVDNTSFEGFIVLDLSNVAGQGIKEVARISHTRDSTSNGENCHYCSGHSINQRSFLFEDKSLMTVHDGAVVSTDLTSGNELWSVSLAMEGEENNCCY